jgi:hypothetical protein
MKTLYAICVFCLWASGATFAQDSIIKHNGDELFVEILEVRSDEIVYKMAENKNVLYTIPKHEVNKVKFSNGIEEIYILSAVAAFPNVQKPSSEELYYMGRRDADFYYKGDGAKWGTFGATFLFAPVGLVTGIVVGAVPPKIENTAPDYQLLQEAAYREGYTKKAKQRKWGKAAGGFGLGLGTALVVGLLLVGASQ